MLMCVDIVLMYFLYECFISVVLVKCGQNDDEYIKLTF